MKVSRRLKTILPAIAGVACAVLTLICTGHVKVKADYIAGTRVQANGSDCSVNTVNVSQPATLTSYGAVYQPNTSNNLYNASAYGSTDILITYDVTFDNTDFIGNYLTGRVLFNDKLTVSTDAITGYTIGDRRYSVALAEKSNENVNVAMIQSGDTFSFYLSVDDLYVPNIVFGVSFTIRVHCTCSLVTSSNSAWRTITPPLVNITHALQAPSWYGTNSIDSHDYNDIKNAIDDSSMLDGMWLKLVELNNRNGYTDTLGNFYSSAELMYLVYGAQSSGNGKLDNIRNYLTTMYGAQQAINNNLINVQSYAADIWVDVNNIRSILSGQGASEAADAKNKLNTAHQTELGAQNQANAILNGLNSGNINFNSGVSSISNIPVTTLVNDNAQSIGFWKTVTGRIMDPTFLGPCATVLCILVILALTVWLLKL